MTAEVPADPGNHGLARPCAIHPVDDLTLPDEQHRGYAGNGELLCQSRTFIYVDLCDCSFSGQFCGDFTHHRCEFQAVRSPGSPELGKHRTGIPLYERSKSCIRQLNWSRVEGGQLPSATAAFAGTSLGGTRNPVGGAAGRAANDDGIFRTHLVLLNTSIPPGFAEISPPLPGAPQPWPPSASVGGWFRPVL